MKRKLAAFFANKKRDGRITSSDIFSIFKHINKHDNVVFNVGTKTISIQYGAILVDDEQQATDIIAFRTDVPCMSSEKATRLDEALGVWIGNIHELYLKGLNVPTAGIVNVSDYKPVDNKYIKKELAEYDDNDRIVTMAVEGCPLTDSMVEADKRVLSKDNTVCCYNSDTQHTCRHLYSETTQETGAVINLECVLLTGNVYKDEL